jgi:hypothetical protein
MPEFDEQAPDREVKVRGRVFHRRNIAPETLFDHHDAEDLEKGISPWTVSDNSILRHFPAEEHEAWRELRADKENPLTIVELNAISSWLWEQATGIPLPSAAPLDNGAGSEGTSSGAASRSRVVTPKK